MPARIIGQRPPVVVLLRAVVAAPRATVRAHSDPRAAQWSPRGARRRADPFPSCGRRQGDARSRGRLLPRPQRRHVTVDRPSARPRRGWQRKERALAGSRAVCLGERDDAALELTHAVVELADRLLELRLRLDDEVAGHGGAVARDRADGVAGVDQRVHGVLDDAVRVPVCEAEDHGELAGTDGAVAPAVVLEHAPETLRGKTEGRHAMADVSVHGLSIVRTGWALVGPYSVFTGREPCRRRPRGSRRRVRGTASARRRW